MKASPSPPPSPPLLYELGIGVASDLYNPSSERASLMLLALPAPLKEPRESSAAWPSNAGLHAGSMLRAVRKLAAASFFWPLLPSALPRLACAMAVTLDSAVVSAVRIMMACLPAEIAAANWPSSSSDAARLLWASPSFELSLIAFRYSSIDSGAGRD